MIDFRVTNAFFNTSKVKAATDRAKRRNLVRMGAFIRRRARSSLRRRKKTAAEGSPPSVHSSGVNLKTIFFFYDLVRESLVVGPVELTTRSTDRTAPNAQEFGGNARVKIKQRNGKKRTRVFNYPKRPFMGPALKKEVDAGVVPKVWTDSVRE